jgi:uncharacterized membrane protein
MRQIVREIEVALPLEQCLHFFRNVACFPRFMKNVDSVCLVDPDKQIWHWVLVNDKGERSEFDIRFQEIVPNSQFTWHTLEGNEIGTSGSLYLVGDGPDRTRLKLDMAYEHDRIGFQEVFSSLLNQPETVIAQNIKTYTGS